MNDLYIEVEGIQKADCNACRYHCLCYVKEYVADPVCRQTQAAENLHVLLIVDPFPNYVAHNR